MVDLPLGVDINNLIDDLRILSWEAADIMLYYSYLIKKDENDESNIIKTKNNNEPVTLADLKVNETIIKGIKKNYNDINWDILSEENTKILSNNSKMNFEWRWILDPLDGTADFIQGTGNYAMHLALQYKNKPRLGVVLIPEKDELWISNGEEVWCERKNGSCLKTNLSNNKTLNDMTLITSKNHKNQTLESLIEKINFNKVTIMGSVGCKIASILRGESDIYISLSLPGKSSPKDWDFAAPEAILTTGGGLITNLENENLNYNKPNFEQRGIIIASNNKQNHENICLEIKEIVKRYNLYPI